MTLDGCGAGVNRGVLPMPPKGEVGMSHGATAHEEGEEVCRIPSVRVRAHEVAPWFAPQKDFLRILKFPVDNVPNL